MGHPYQNSLHNSSCNSRTWNLCIGLHKGLSWPSLHSFRSYRCNLGLGLQTEGQSVSKVDWPINQLIYWSFAINQPSDWSVNQTFNQYINLSINQTIRQSVSHSVSEWTNQTHCIEQQGSQTDGLIEETNYWGIDKLVNRRTNESLHWTARKTIQQVALTAPAQFSLIWSLCGSLHRKSAHTGTRLGIAGPRLLVASWAGPSAMLGGRVVALAGSLLSSCSARFGASRPGTVLAPAAMNWSENGTANTHCFWPSDLTVHREKKASYQQWKFGNDHEQKLPVVGKLRLKI